VRRLFGRGAHRDLGAADALLELLDFALRRIEASPELADQRIELFDQAVLIRELDLEVDDLVGKLRWIGHRDLLSRGMRALLVGLVVVCACEVPANTNAEPSAAAGPAAPTRAPSKISANGVDCVLIGQTITSLELGNYAEPEVRAPREKEITALCVAENLTKSDAACVLAAASLDDLAYCPKPLVAKRVVLPPVTPGDICEQYVRTLERIARCPNFPPDSAKALRGQIPTLRKMYAQYGSQKQLQESCQMAIDMTEKAYKPIGC
jgi:hypothetical protein